MSEFDVDESLPKPQALFQRCVGLAALDLIAGGDTYSLEESEGVWCFSFDSGAGDNLVLAFSPQGAVLRAFDHESDTSPYVSETIDSRVWENLPSELIGLLGDEGPLGAEEGEDLFPGEIAGRMLELPAASFALWWDEGEGDWEPEWVEEERHENGRDWLLERAFDSWDTDFELDGALVERVLAHETLDDATLLALGAKESPEVLREGLEALSYGKPYPLA